MYVFCEAALNVVLSFLRVVTPSTLPGDHNQLQHWFMCVVLYAHILSLKCTDKWPSMQYTGFFVYLVANSVSMPSQKTSGYHEM